MVDASQHVQAEAKKIADIQLQQERMRNEARERELIAEERRKAAESSQKK